MPSLWRLPRLLKNKNAEIAEIATFSNIAEDVKIAMFVAIAEIAKEEECRDCQKCHVFQNCLDCRDR